MIKDADAKVKQLPERGCETVTNVLQPVATEAPETDGETENLSDGVSCSSVWENKCSL